MLPVQLCALGVLVVEEGVRLGYPCPVGSGIQMGRLLPALVRCRKEGMSVPEEFGMREPPSPSSAGLVLVSPRAGASLTPVRFSLLQLYSPEVSSTWDVSGEGTKYLLGSCFGFFQKTKDLRSPELLTWAPSSATSGARRVPVLHWLHGKSPRMVKFLLGGFFWPCQAWEPSAPRPVLTLDKGRAVSWSL